MSLLLNTPFPTEIYQGHTLLITIFRCLRDDTSINEYYSTGRRMLLIIKPLNWPDDVVTIC